MGINDLARLKRHYQTDGYLVLPHFFSDEEVRDFTQEVDPIFSKWADTQKADIFIHKLLNMHSLTLPEYFASSPNGRLRLFELIHHPKLTQMLDGIFGSDLYFHNTQLFFNPSNPARLPYWHRDLQYSPMPEEEQAAELSNMLNLHLRIPLIKETGLELIPGTHMRWDSIDERKVRLELDGHKNSEQLPGSKLITLEAGDVLLFNAQMLHRGQYALNAKRFALDLCLGKYHPLTGKALDKNCLPTLYEMDKLSNNHWYQVAHQIVKQR
jgi:hypothetical protein